VLAEEATLLEGVKKSQIIGSKCNKVTFRDEKEQRPSKKAKGRQQEKYCRSITVKMGYQPL